MLSSDIPTKVSTPFANGAVAPYTRVVPVASQIGIQDGAASFTDGFPPLTFTSTGAGGVPPWGADFNGLLNQTTAWVRWISAGGGIAVYDAAFSTAVGGYPLGALLGQTAAPGRFWQSTVENNTSNPDTGGANWTSVPALPAVPTYQRLTSGSGNFAPTSALVRYVEIEMVGPGAGGGAAFTNNGTAPSADASFGAWTAIRGGVGNKGFSGSADGLGGLGGSGGVNGAGVLIDRIDGGDGQSGGNVTNINGVHSGGNGGSNPRGGAGRGSQGAGSNAAANSGAGGGGASGFVNPNGAGGGGGGAGEYVKFQMTYAQANSAAYVVPAGGAGGAAGTNAGGNGAASIIIIKEFYQ